MAVEKSSLLYDRVRILVVFLFYDLNTDRLCVMSSVYD